MSDTKITFPSIPVTHWWKLRKKFQQSIPSAVTPGFIATVLNMKETSAKANVIPALLAFGLIDENGKPKDRAVRWRDDEEYAKVCEEIRNEIYPQELLEALPLPASDRDSVERWFARRTGSGKNAVQKMATTYLLLCEANPSKTQGISKHQSTGKAMKRAPQKSKSQSAKHPISTDSAQPDKKESDFTFIPSIHIDVQVHISPDSTPDQIDHIFASIRFQQYIYNSYVSRSKFFQR